MRNHPIVVAFSPRSPAGHGRRRSWARRWYRVTFIRLPPTLMLHQRRAWRRRSIADTADYRTSGRGRSPHDIGDRSRPRPPARQGDRLHGRCRNRSVSHDSLEHLPETGSELVGLDAERRIRSLASTRRMKYLGWRSPIGLLDGARYGRRRGGSGTGSTVSLPLTYKDPSSVSKCRRIMFIESCRVAVDEEALPERGTETVEPVPLPPRRLP